MTPRPMISAIMLLFIAVSAQDYDWEFGDEGKVAPSAAAVQSDTGQNAPQEYAQPAETVAAEQDVAAADATHTIRKGDTLWDLAQKLLGDPFEWERIQEFNRSFITNPDLIFPGDVLRIPGMQERGVARAPVRTYRPTVSQTEIAPVSDTAVRSDEYSADSTDMGPLDIKEVLSRGFLGSAPRLWTGKMPGPFGAEVIKPSFGAAYQLFGQLTARPARGVSYSVGDTVDVISVVRIVRFREKPASIVKRTGRCRITDISKREINALIFGMNDVIKGGERLVLAEKTVSRKIDTLVAPDQTIIAEVFTRVEQTERPYPFQKVILDKGSTHGVAAGDIFGVYHRDEKESVARLNVIGCIIHAGTEAATLNMVLMRKNAISPGDTAVLLRRSLFSDGE